MIACSAGNHAQGVAYHAQRLGIRAVIVMPRFTPGVKVERTRGFGAEGILVRHMGEVEPALQQARAFAAQGKPVLVNVWLDKTAFREGSLSM